MYFLGIDLGGTNIAAGIVDENYHVVVKTSRKTVLPCSGEEMSAQLSNAAQETLQKANLSFHDIPWIGVGCPGTINRENGRVDFANNLHFIRLPLCKLLEDRLGKKVILENDANAAAYGEWKAGALKGAQSAIAITLGTGIGSGIILDGKIYSGSNYAGGELGHTVIVANGRPCTCGRRGCWETYASATGLIVSTKEAMEKDKTSAMWEITGGDPKKADGRTAFQAMRKGDRSGKAVVDKYIFYLACGLTNCINIFQPDILCVGGGVSNEGEPLMAPLKKAVASETYSKYSDKQTVICRAQLGNDAGIVGAALLGQNI
jgi:glucokinase